MISESKKEKAKKRGTKKSISQALQAELELDESLKQDETLDKVSKSNSLSSLEYTQTQSIIQTSYQNSDSSSSSTNLKQAADNTNKEKFENLVSNVLDKTNHVSGRVYDMTQKQKKGIKLLANEALFHKEQVKQS